MSQIVPGKPFDCPSRRAIQLLQEKWVLNIVRTLLDGPRGFNELGREAGGCNPSTLTQRLTKLEQLGLVCKRCEPDCSRATYVLTAAGEGLSDVLDAIEAWASDHLAEDAQARREATPAFHADLAAAVAAPAAQPGANGSATGDAGGATQDRAARPDGVRADGFRLDGSRIDLDRSAVRRPSASSGRARVARTLAGSNGVTSAEEGAGEAASSSGEGSSPTP